MNTLVPWLRWLPPMAAVAVCLLSAPRANPADRHATEPDKPVFRVDVSYPTKDKPQSKLWFAHGTWWAWLPVRDGGSVWKRTLEGWFRQTELDRPLAGLPGQADVWADGGQVRAVLVDEKRLAIAALKWDGASRGYVPAGTPVQLAPSRDANAKGVLETATIACDSRSRWWIAYSWRRNIWVRASRDASGTTWSEAQSINELPTSKDDICAIVALPGRIGVIWSDQANDTVYFRYRADRADREAWQPVEVAARGGKTADDHIHAVAGKDGTLYIATKNSVDLVGSPQLVLRIRGPKGGWKNLPYAVRTARHQPSRPIALLGGRPPRLFLLHSLYRMDRPKPPQSTIAWLTVDPARLNIPETDRTLIDAGTHLNDVTGPKAPLPSGEPWIVLASDKSGNVYEARID